MKKVVLLIVATLLTLTPAFAQTRLPVQYAGKEYTDSATMIVGRYLDILNYGALRSDSTLHITSMVTKRSTPGDTLYIHHYHTAPEYDMVELIHNGKRLLAYYKDGYGNFKRWEPDEGTWQNMAESDYNRHALPLDYHSSLYEWEATGMTLTYEGLWDYKGHPVYRVYAKTKSRYDRYYLFEKESGLLFFVDELQTRNGEPTDPDATDRIDWRAYEEYHPIGNCIMPSKEIYQQGGDITRIERKFEYIKKGEKGMME